MSEFIRASQLYDVAESEQFQFDWEKMQPLAASQAEVEQAILALEQGQREEPPLQLHR